MCTRMCTGPGYGPVLYLYSKFTHTNSFPVYVPSSRIPQFALLLNLISFSFPMSLNFTGRLSLYQFPVASPEILCQDILIFLPSSAWLSSPIQSGSPVHSPFQSPGRHVPATPSLRVLHRLSRHPSTSLCSPSLYTLPSTGLASSTFYPLLLLLLARHALLPLLCIHSTDNFSGNKSK